MWCFGVSTSLPADHGRITVFVPYEADAGTGQAQVIEALAKTGVLKASATLANNAVVFDDDDPTIAKVERIRRALREMTARSNIRTELRAMYATDDCDVGARNAIAAAVADARAAAIRIAAQRHVTLASVVAADDVGAAPVAYCGPGVLDVVRARGPSDAGAEAFVVSHATVRLTFELKLP